MKKGAPCGASYGRGTNYCTIWLKIPPKLRQNCTQKTRHRRRAKLAAALRAAANFVRRGCRVFARGFAKLRVNFQRSVAIIVPSTVLSSERVNGQRAKNLEKKLCASEFQPLQNSKKGHQKWAASPPTLRAGFSSFGGVELARA